MGLKIIMKNLVSPQYLREEKIYVTIVEVKSPVYYVIKESPSMNTASTYASKFLELEESMQKYYGSLEPTFFQLPVKDTVLIVEHEKKYYRAKVCSILNLPRSYLIKVYLLDYGKECSVPKSSLFEMHPDFMSVPFQVIDFKLPGLEPMSFVMNPFDMTVNYGTATEWDPSASTFIEGILKALHNAFVKVEGGTKNCIFGTLHVTLPDGEEKCLNDELVFKKFASQNPECWNNITRLAEILSKENLSNSNVSQSGSNNSEAPKSPCTNSKSLPVSELSSPKSVKSPVTSTIVSEIANETMKNKDEHSTESESVTSQTNKLRNVNKISESTSKNTVLKTTEESKCDQSVSVSPNGSTLQKFKQLLARRAAQKQQNMLQTLSDNSCSNCPPRISQSEMDLPVANAHSSELVKKEKISPVLNISATQSESVGSNLSPSATACCEFGKTEKLVHQPANSATVQDVSIAESAPLVKSDGEQGVGSQISSSPEQIEVSKKVDPAKVKAFYERNRKARATFLAQKKSKQDLDNANSQFTMTSPSKSSETGTHLVATKVKNVGKEHGTSKLSETEAKLIDSDIKNVEVSCRDNSDTNKLELADESLDSHCKSMKSQTISESKENVKPKVDPGKVKKFFEQSRKTRAKFLARSKSNQDLDNESSQSEMTSPPLVDCKPSETERKSSAAPEIMNMEKFCENDSDANILELVHDSSDSNCTSFLSALNLIYDSEKMRQHLDSGGVSI